MADKLPPEILKRISEVRNKRARLLLDTIAKRGSITTEELKQAGYDHPPRAARDVRELGFPLITTRVQGPAGRRIAKYSLDATAILDRNKSGRVALPKKERDAIIEAAGDKCQFCGATYNLQVDHSVPYEVAGESPRGERGRYLVLDGSCNRRKSWACEHCKNLLGLKRVAVCRTCYWGNPQKHSHIAMQPMRRIEVVWQKEETAAFDAFIRKCEKEEKDPTARIKAFVRSGE